MTALVIAISILAALATVALLHRIARWFDNRARINRRLQSSVRTTLITTNAAMKPTANNAIRMSSSMAGV